MPRRLLNIASIVCLVLCVALMGMWVRSYYWMDEFGFNPLGAFSVGGGSAVRSHCDWHTERSTPNQHWFRFTHSPVGDWRSELATIDQRLSTVAGFGIVYNVDAFGIMVPYWFAVLIVGALSFAPWSRVKYRFSLRSLFIATTFLPSCWE